MTGFLTLFSEYVHDIKLLKAKHNILEMWLWLLEVLYTNIAWWLILVGWSHRDLICSLAVVKSITHTHTTKFTAHQILSSYVVFITDICSEANFLNLAIPMSTKLMID